MTAFEVDDYIGVVLTNILMNFNLIYVVTLACFVRHTISLCRGTGLKMLVQC